MKTPANDPEYRELLFKLFGNAALLYFDSVSEAALAEMTQHVQEIIWVPHFDHAGVVRIWSLICFSSIAPQQLPFLGRTWAGEMQGDSYVYKFSARASELEQIKGRN
jgi:hypothetical protein